VQSYNLAKDRIGIATIPAVPYPVLLIPAITANGPRAINQGGEAAAHYDVRQGLQITGSYSALFSRTILGRGIDSSTAFALPYYSPAHQWQARASWDISSRWTSEVAFYRVGELRPDALPGYSRLDFRIARRMGKLAELSLGGQNMLRPRQQEYVGNIVYPTGVIARSVQIGVRWNFR
jgi:outer membrane receptor protein involved in Fe transport